MTTEVIHHRNPNNLVADCDLKASLACLEEYSSSKQNENAPLASSTIQSFVQHLQRIVQSVPEAEFQALIDAYHYGIVVENEDEEDDRRRLSDVSDASVEEGEASSKQQVVVNNNDNFDFEDAELLNTDALQKAKELRAQVRSAAQEVSSLRDSVLQQVLEEYEANSEHSRLMKMTTAQQEQQRPVLVPPESITNLDNVSDSLQALVDLLHSSNLQASLSQESDRFQEMIEIIQQETSEARTMSQTEVAITARDYHRHQQQDDDNDEDDAPFDPSMCPSELLANFLM